MAHIFDVNHRRPRQFRRIDLQHRHFSDEELRRRYRFSSANIDRLVDLLRDRLERPTHRNQSVSAKVQVLVALRFYATGNFLQVIGDTFGLDVATVCRIVTRVTDALFDLKDRAIKFPKSNDERQAVKAGFYEMRKLPGVVGCIDGTHVRIIAPGREEEAAYINRKHQHSLNVQATCDHLGTFTSINACWPGSCHDSHVLRTSNLCRYLETYHQDPEKGYLLGDSGYPCRPFLLTPFGNPETPHEEGYNKAHMGTRNLIERVFGVWKRKFHVLHSEIRMRPLKASRIVVACGVLYNLSILWKEPAAVDVEEEDDQPPAEPFDGQMDGKDVRARVARTYF